MSKQVVVKRGESVFFKLNGKVVLGQVVSGKTARGVAIRNIDSGHVCNVRRSAIVNIATSLK